MEASQSGGALTLWLASGNPDDDIHNAFGIRAATSELYMNTDNYKLFFCAVGGTPQTWFPMSYANRSQSPASRSLDSAFQIDADRDAQVSYSVSIQSSMTDSSVESGSVILEIASDSGFTTDVQEIGRLTNGNSGVLTSGLASDQTIAGCLSGYVPAGFYVRLRTDSTIGTPSFSYVSGQEVLF